MRPCPEDVRAAMRWREEKARKPLAFGRMSGPEMEMVYKCAECGEWIGAEPKGPNVTISHGLCTGCADKTLEEADA